MFGSVLVDRSVVATQDARQIAQGDTIDGGETERPAVVIRPGLMKPMDETHGVARVVNEARVRPICRASSAVRITPYRVRNVASSAPVQSGGVRHPLWLA